MDTPIALPDRFRILGLIGEGKRSRVWQVEDRNRPDLPLALKEFTAAAPDDLRHGLTILARLRHPGLVGVHTIHPRATGDIPAFFTMDHVVGPRIDAAVQTEGARACLALIAEGLAALAVLHENDLAHGALSPANLLLHGAPRRHRLVLLDYGPAMRGRPGNGPGGAPERLPYLAPERFDTAEPDPRSDLYALGVVVFEAVHGRLPIRIEGNDISGFVDAVRAGRRARPALPPDYPEALDGWLETLLSPDASSRPRDAREALAGLARVEPRLPHDASIDTAAADSAPAPEIEVLYARTDEPAEALADASVDRKLLVLYEMTRSLNSESDIDTLLESILDSALRVVGADRGMILLRDTDDGEFSVRVTRRLDPETVEDAETFSRSIAAQAGSGKSVLALDAQHDERFRDLRSVSLHGIHSLMCVPLRSRGTITGTVYLDNRLVGRQFTPENVRFLEAFADHAAVALDNARTRAQLHEENERLQAAAEEQVRYGNLVGASEAMRGVFSLIEKVAESDLPVLIHGESGTGKELVARAIHFNGSRRRQAFVTENCAAIPDTLLQSELFGHVRGAFTGADRDRAGLFELADGGTLFLDEVGDMSPGMQAQLLRALQEGEVRRVGGNRTLKVDVRVLAATHRNLEAEVAARRFREDLMYRLQVMVIQIPPLRDRAGEIPVLADHFVRKVATERGRPVCRIENDVLRLFERYAWPGNVRQLETTIQRLSLLAGGEPISLAVLETDPALRHALIGPRDATPRPQSLDCSEREQIRQALDAAEGNRSRAARLLGISRATIYRKLKEYEI